MEPLGVLRGADPGWRRIPESQSLPWQRNKVAGPRWKEHSLPQISPVAQPKAERVVEVGLFVNQSEQMAVHKHLFLSAPQLQCKFNSVQHPLSAGGPRKHAGCGGTHSNHGPGVQGTETRLVILVLPWHSAQWGPVEGVGFEG